MLISKAKQTKYSRNSSSPQGQRYVTALKYEKKPLIFEPVLKLRCQESHPSENCKSCQKHRNMQTMTVTMPEDLQNQRLSVEATKTLQDESAKNLNSLLI